MIVSYGPDLCVDHGDGWYGLLVPWTAQKGVTHFVFPGMLKSNRRDVITAAVLAYGQRHGSDLSNVVTPWALEKLHADTRKRVWKAMRKAGFQTTKLHVSLA